uniref:Uncharacterized protein n=1 Tax=viral metagenome TaxID=1070528 RepID=A0A6M3KNW1_9ZZZZ
MRGCTGVDVTLDGSESGVNYQLQIDGVNSGAPVAGTGSGLTWANQIAGGSYTVIATNATTGCILTMTGNVVVSINPLPVVQSVTGGGPYCAGGTGVQVSLANSETGINYQLQLDGVNNSAIVDGNSKQ